MLTYYNKKILHINFSAKYIYIYIYIYRDIDIEIDVSTISHENYCSPYQNLPNWSSKYYF